jgi:hypothetical protein
MKTILTLFLCAVSLAPLSAQPAAPSADLAAKASAAAEAAYATFQTLSKERPPGSPQDIGAEKYLTWSDTHRQAVQTAALAFYAAYPADARRWELVMAAVKAPPYFIQSFGPDVEQKGPGAIIADEAAAAAWRQQAAELTTAMLASADAPPALREDAEWGLFAKDFRATSAAKAKGEAYDFGGFRARFDAHVAKYAELDAVAARAADYLGALERNLPGASTEIWQHLLAAPNAALRTKAAERLKFLDLISRPLELAFTAADGRAVDLKSLRGKVVLIDFWATWCVSGRRNCTTNRAVIVLHLESDCVPCGGSRKTGTHENTPSDPPTKYSYPGRPRLVRAKDFARTRRAPEDSCKISALSAAKGCQSARRLRDQSQPMRALASADS